MTRFTSARWCRILAVLFGLAESGEQRVYAQAIPCAGPPPAPANAAASIAPVSPNLPAAVTIQWLGVPVTGPNAVASYIVEAGNAPGAANVARFDTGTTGLSTVQMATNGTYYIRVRSANACGLSAPSPEPVVTIAGGVDPGLPAAGPVMATVTRRPDLYGDVLLTGEIRGAWGARATPGVHVQATFFNSVGQELGQESTYVLGRSRRILDSRETDWTTLGAADTGCFAMFTYIPDVAVARFTIETGWGTEQLEVLRGDVVAQNVQKGADSLGNLHVQGELRNAGTVTTLENVVHLDVRGALDRVTGCDWVPLPHHYDELALGEVGSFDTYFDDVPSASVSRIRAWGTWDESDTGPTTPTAAPLTWQSLVPGVRDIPVLDAKGRARMRNAAIRKLRTISKPADAR